MAWNPFRSGWDGFGRAKALTASAEVVEGVRQGWSPFPLLGGGARQRIQEAFAAAQNASYAWVYARSPAVRTVVDVIVRNVGQLDLRLYEEITEARREPRPDHPAALSLQYPSETVPQAKLVRGLFKDFLLYDNAYALLTQSSGGRVGVQRLPAHMVEVVGSSLFSADGYRFRRRDGLLVDLEPDQVLHWHGENPEDPRFGVSRLDTLRSVIAEDAALQQAIVELANAGLTEPAWVFRPLDAPQWSNDARKGFEEDLMNRLRRRNRTPVVLEEGMEMRSFGVSPKDAQMMDVRRWAIEQVAREYGVPLGMVGLDDGVDAARGLFYADTLPPYCEDFTRMLDHRVLVGVYGWTAGRFEFNLDEKHMGDDRLRSLVSATGRPVLTTNEARAMVNKPPLDGGELLVTPLNVMVGDNPQASVDVPNEPAPGSQPRGVGLEQQQQRRALKAADGEPGRVPQFVPSRKADLERQHRSIDLAQAAVERHYARLTRSLKARKAAADWGRWDRELGDDLHGLLERIVELEGSVYSMRLAGEFDMGRVRNYVRAMADGSAEAINQTIRGEIDDLGLDEALARRGQHVASAGAGLGAAATRWAREEAARQAPGTEGRVKTWVADTERHAEFDGTTVALGAPWPAGFAPGSAPGCRCTQTIT